jgi:hypothetical protein
MSKTGLWLLSMTVWGCGLVYLAEVVLRWQGWP